MGFTRKSGAAFAVFLSLAIVVMTPPASGQTLTVTLAWDPNTEATVAGYIVYVGNESGRYREQIDVGPLTSFVYPNPIPGRPYYFAVAAYESRERVGPRSEEVFYLNGVAAASLMEPASAASRVDDMSGRAAEAIADDSRRTVCAAHGDCYSVDRIAAVGGSASALELASDGRLFFIHDGASIRVVDGERLMAEPALSRDAAYVTFVDLVLDPDFGQNRFAYIAEVVTTADGRRELNIARYRELGNAFGERAVIVSGLPMSPGGTAAMTVDSARRLYVALPADGSRPSDPYQGMVLRFDRDGSVPDKNRAGSPVFARGYAEPVSLEWDAARRQLWLTGTGAGSAQAPIARLSVDDGTRETESTAGSAGRGSGDIVLIDKANGVVQIASRIDRALSMGLISSTALGGEPTSATSQDGERDDIYISLIVARPNSSPTSQILRLRRD